MTQATGRRIIVVDDEPDSRAVMGLTALLANAGWAPGVVRPDPDVSDHPYIGEAYEAAAVEAVAQAIRDRAPPLDAVILDLEFGDRPLKGLDILRRLSSSHPSLPVLVLTKHSQGPYRKAGVQESYKSGLRVEYVDKLASAEEVVLRLRRLIGDAREVLVIPDKVSIDPESRTVQVKVDGQWRELQGFDGHKFEVFREVAAAYIRHPDAVVPYERLRNYYEIESLRVRVSEMNQELKQHGLGALQPRRNLGYRLVFFK